MEHFQYNYLSSSNNNNNSNIFERRPIVKSSTPAVKWVKRWVPQDVVATGGKCCLLKWLPEDSLKALEEKEKKLAAAEPEPEPEPATEVLFLCSYEGCGKTFTEAGALKKHSHIHGEKQHVCHYEGCGKKFLDSSKLKRHFLTHTGERDFVCPVEGCGKAFSLDFNLKSHMKTHSLENYHICPYPDCGKRYTHEYKLKNHIASHHEKNSTVETSKYAAPSEKPLRTPKTSARASGASSNRPYACPYEGCEKAYIHRYKLNLHWREHPDHNPAENAAPTNADNEMIEGSNRDGYAGNRSNGKNPKESNPKSDSKMASSVTFRKSTSSSPASMNLMKQSWPAREEVYEDDDSEETEDDRDNVEEGSRYAEDNMEDDEETEYED